MYDYKTTYFIISLNNEISNSKSNYDNKINNRNLLESISEIENDPKIQEILNSFKIEDMTLLNLDEIQQELKQYTPKKIKKLIELKTELHNLNNRRFTEEHKQELNIHLKEIAKDGWKLFSMTPIIKGYKEKEEGMDAFGLGHDVLEGFVLVWEKQYNYG
ncbi:MAG: hypothetical protein H6588_02505 [Flavobacteriales bacterium]|nr:hypothetical protein [Flavobacteriales bacterium]